MSALRTWTLLSAIAFAPPAAAWAAPPQWGTPVPQVAYDQGYRRGQVAGVDDARHGDAFQFVDESDYRHGDAGYRSSYGNRDRYRALFRQGFQTGYRDGYEQYNYVSRRDNVPQRPNGRYVLPRRYAGDRAFETGFNDGYEAGLKDGRDRHRMDPVSEGRYRSADHGYKRQYGSKDRYKINYREAFRDGYEQGYADARRYDRR